MGVRTDEAAEFTAFVRETGTQLHRAALLLTGDHHLAEDLTQATFTKVYAAWRRVTDNRLGYARSTLLNTFLSHRRLRRNSERPAEVAIADEVAGPAGDPDARLDLLDALATLAPIDRAVVVLRYWEDRSVADTAVDLGLTEAAVRTKAKRSLERLRPLISERTIS